MKQSANQKEPLSPSVLSSLIERALSKRTGILTLCVLGLMGCSNPCEDFAERMCDKAGSDRLACETSEASDADPKTIEKAHTRCERIQAVVVSCSELKEVARHASDEDQLACKQNLEFIRALEKQTE